MPLSISKTEKKRLDCIECCECAVAVGTDGSQRAALLLPCQHVMHLNCIEFVKRRAKLLKLYEETKLNSFSFDMVCSGCQQSLNSVIPLFTTAEVLSQPSPAEGVVESEFHVVHDAQKRYLRRLHHTLHQKAKVTELSQQCAALHIQQNAYLREVELHSQLFPQLTPVGVNPFTESSFSSFSFNNMTITELELYLMQITPIMNQTQTSLLEKRRTAEKQKQTLLALKERYLAKKRMIRAVKRKTAWQGERPERVESVRGPEPVAASSTLAYPRPDRCLDAVFVDVDEEGALTSKQDNDTDGGQPGLGLRNGRKCNSLAATEAFVISSSEDEETSLEVSATPVHTDTTARTNTLGHGDHEKEVTASMLFPRSIRGRDTDRKLRMRQLQLLPRCENYLWQSSLSF